MAVSAARRFQRRVILLLISFLFCAGLLNLAESEPQLLRIDLLRATTELRLLKLLDDRTQPVVLDPLGLDERFQCADIVGQPLVAAGF